MKHSELVEVVPALGQLAVRDTNERHPAELNLFASRGEAQPVALVSATRTPSDSNDVTFGNEVLDFNGDRDARFDHV